MANSPHLTMEKDQADYQQDEMEDREKQISEPPDDDIYPYC